VSRKLVLVKEEKVGETHVEGTFQGGSTIQITNEGGITDIATVSNWSQMCMLLFLSNLNHVAREPKCRYAPPWKDGYSGVETALSLLAPLWLNVL
jgi:hypothetical protein